MKFEQFLESVPKIKNLPLPAVTSQLKMSPPFRRQLMVQYKEQMKRAKKAGVMALFFPNTSQETKIALILRKTYHGVHSAQIGFPGGKLEPDDVDLEMAAVRETYEEIGVPQEHIEVLRELTDVYIPPSNFYVRPFIGIVRQTPEFLKQDDEVEDIVEVFLTDFLNEENVVNTSVETIYNRNVQVPAYILNDHIVWGATAMMLSEIKDLLKDAL